MASSNSSKMTIKLLIDTKRNKVVCAEASKVVIDFLFNLLSLPLSSVVRLLNKNIGMVGSLGNLYQSVENLHDSYMQQHNLKNVLLRPKASWTSSTQVSGLLLNAYNDDVDDNIETKFYGCSRCPV
ncbi:hypothetical protein SESBI_04418 [Sesbania bispinosa]|nr:hypothetical protein SESBI_04418 [Sesbania bispinosa]